MKSSKAIKIIIIGLILAVIILVFYYHISNTAKSKSEEEVHPTMVQNVLMKDLERSYPPSPKEVLKYYSEITKCFYNEEYTEEELAGLDLIRQNGQDYYYSESHFLFLPTDVEPTKEELAAEEAGDLFISYGSDEREEQTYLSMSWNADGKHFTLGGFDLGLNAQDMIDMAMQLQ